MFLSQHTTTHGPVVVRSWTLKGLHGIPVDVEVDVRPGLPQCILVGLPDASVIEARDRVRSAIANTGLKFPPTRVTVNLAPAHVRKQGTQFDVPIALGLIAAARQCSIPTNVSIVGELALDGRLRAVRGALPLVVAALEQTNDTVIAPAENAPELSLLESDRVRVAASLQEIVEAFQNDTMLPVMAHSLLMQHERKVHATASTSGDHRPATHTAPPAVDCADIIGQSFAKRAIEIAAAGQHHMILNGPPGVGKSMLAAALATLLPPMTPQERTTIAMIHSLVSPLTTVPQTRPFRSPHHTASAPAIIGGGTALLPGEITLAHHGVLFLDELPEFRRDVLEALRQPMESGTITITRAAGQVTYPAQCVVVGAYNPCPCGYYGAQQRACTCSMAQVNHYRKKLSGPLMDRCDIKVTVNAVDPEEMETISSDTQSSTVRRDTSQTIRAQTTAARERQLARQQQPNAALHRRLFHKYAPLTPHARRLLSQATRTYQLSMRMHDKTIRVARTIADLAAADTIDTLHVAEALRFTAPSGEQVHGQ